MLVSIIIITFHYKLSLTLEPSEANKRANSHNNVHLHLLRFEIQLKVLSTAVFPCTKKFIFIPLFRNNHFAFFIFLT
jgi:hypothetical protein